MKSLTRIIPLYSRIVTAFFTFICENTIFQCNKSACGNVYVEIIVVVKITDAGSSSNPSIQKQGTLPIGRRVFPEEPLGIPVGKVSVGFVINEMKHRKLPVPISVGKLV